MIEFAIVLILKHQFDENALAESKQKSILHVSNAHQKGHRQGMVQPEISQKPLNNFEVPSNVITKSAVAVPNFKKIIQLSLYMFPPVYLAFNITYWLSLRYLNR